MTNWLNKHRFTIGLSLILLIILGGVVLLWQKKSFSQTLANTNSQDQNIAENLSLENQDLKNKITELEKEIKNLKEGANQGKVAGTTTSKSTVSSNTATIQGKININTANLAQLDTLPGIGATRAQQIIDYRTTNGGFKTIEEIKNIKGIGEVTFAKMKDLITVEN